MRTYDDNEEQNAYMKGRQHAAMGYQSPRLGCAEYQNYPNAYNAGFWDYCHKPIGSKAKS